jgi:hypothetical protein
MEIPGGLFDGLYFLIYSENLPNGDAVAGEIGLASREGIAKGNARELGLEAFLDDVARHEIAF